MPSSSDFFVMMTSPCNRKITPIMLIIYVSLADRSFSLSLESENLTEQVRGTSKR